MHLPTDAAVMVGFWGPPTSSIDWCEPNYAVTHYIAEFFNASSNIVTCGLALSVFLYARAHNLEKRFTLAPLLVALVGFGSFCFHGSLRYEAQMLDELPMIYMQLVFMYITIENQTKRKFKHLMPALWAAGILYSLIHYQLRLIVIFHIVFASLVLPTAWPLVAYRHDRTTNRIFWKSLGFFALSFALWKLDQAFCPQVQRLHLHAVWHVGTALSAYEWIMGSIYIRLRHTLGLQSVEVRRKWGLLTTVVVTSPVERSLIQKHWSAPQRAGDESRQADIVLVKSADKVERYRL
ncbi:alkaline ceramidase ydc1 [Sorochytrium milnesiophthora]